VAPDRGVVPQHDALWAQGVLDGAKHVVPDCLESGREQLDGHMLSISVDDQGRKPVAFGMYDAVCGRLGREVPALLRGLSEASAPPVAVDDGVFLCQ
jgi:hypothetical protein